MNREEKAKEIESIKKKFASAKAVLFAQNNGLKVSEVTDLRKTLAKEKSSLKVVKNRLLKRALSESKIEGLDAFIEGAVAIATSDADPVTTAKTLVQFVKDHEKLAIMGGYVDGKAFATESIKALADLPSREVLYSMFLRCLNSPATQLVSVLAAVPRQLVTVIDAIKKQKEKS